MKKAHLAFCVALVTLVGMNQFARAADPTHPDQPSVAPAEAISKLKEGNGRYTSGNLQHPGQTAERRTELAKTQHPFATFSVAPIPAFHLRLSSIRDLVIYLLCELRET